MPPSLSHISHTEKKSSENKKKSSFFSSLIYNFKVENFFLVFLFNFKIPTSAKRNARENAVKRKCSNVVVYSCMFISKINIGSYTDCCIHFKFCNCLSHQKLTDNIINTLQPVEFRFHDSFLWSKILPEDFFLSLYII